MLPHTLLIFAITTLSFVSASAYNGGHDMLCWRGSVADGLIALVGKQKEK